MLASNKTKQNNKQKVEVELLEKRKEVSSSRRRQERVLGEYNPNALRP